MRVALSQHHCLRQQHACQLPLTLNKCAEQTAALQVHIKVGFIHVPALRAHDPGAHDNSLRPCTLMPAHSLTMAPVQGYQPLRQQQQGC